MTSLALDQILRISKCGITFSNLFLGDTSCHIVSPVENNDSQQSPSEIERPHHKSSVSVESHPEEHQCVDEPQATSMTLRL